MRLLNIASQIPFVLSSDKDETGEPLPGATTFMLRCLSATENGALEDSLVGFSGSTINGVDEKGDPKVEMGKMQLSMSGRTINRVRLGVCGWDSLTDDDGNEIDFGKEAFQVGGRQLKGLPIALVDRFPAADLKELSNKIESLSNMTHHEGN